MFPIWDKLLAQGADDIERLPLFFPTEQSCSLARDLEKDLKAISLPGMDADRPAEKRIGRIVHPDHEELSGLRFNRYLRRFNAEKMIIIPILLEDNFCPRIPLHLATVPPKITKYPGIINIKAF